MIWVSFRRSRITFANGRGTTASPPSSMPDGLEMSGLTGTSKRIFIESLRKLSTTSSNIREPARQMLFSKHAETRSFSWWKTTASDLTLRKSDLIAHPDVDSVWLEFESGRQ